MAYKSFNKITAHLKAELQRLPEAALAKPEILDEFLALCDRNVSVGDEAIASEIISVIKQALIASLLEDQTGNRFVGYLKLAGNSPHSFIREAFEEALAQFSHADTDQWVCQKQFFAIFEKVISYKQSQTSNNPLEMDLLQQTLNLIPQICRGWVCSRDHFFPPYSFVPESLPQPEFSTFENLSRLKYREVSLR